MRKRDKRVDAHRQELDKLNDQNRKKSKENRSKQLTARKKELENFQENEWASMYTLEANLKEIENNYEKEAKSKKKSKKRKSKEEVEVTIIVDEEGASEEGADNGNESGTELERPSNLAEAVIEEKRSSDSSEDDEDDVLYCVACDKAFKSTKSFENHENSKKHKTNLAYLKVALEEDESLL